MGFFQEASDSEIDVKGDDESTDAVFRVTLAGACAALSFSLEVIWIRWLQNRGVDGPPGCYMALLFDGLYGIIMLVVLTLIGEGIQ